MRLPKPDQRGETLVEVVMALGILSLVLVSSYVLATSTFRLGRGAGQRTQAVNYLQEQAEALRTYRDSVSWDREFATGTGVAGYSKVLGRSFCMIQTTLVSDPSTKVWRPIDSGNAGCLRDGIRLAVQSEAVGAAPIEQYNFTFVGTWKTASEDQRANLTTKLVRQG